MDFILFPVRTVRNDKNGKEHGKFTEWYENGQKSTEENYKDGELDGKSTRWIHRMVRKRDGKRTSWYGITEGNYNDGKNDGIWTEWYKSGQKQSERNYKDGKEHGSKTHYSYYENGQKKQEEKFSIRPPKVWYVKDGKFTSWYESGNIRTEATYKDGVCISGRRQNKINCY